VLLLLSNFCIVSQQTNVPASLKCAPRTERKRQLQSKIPLETSLHEAGTEAAQDGWDDHDNNGNNIEPVKRVKCRGGPNALWAKYGIQFETCICQAFPVKSLMLQEIARECYFVSMSTNKMQNNHKRNLVYWWYATNIYFICGAHNRAELPECLVWDVRRHFPNKPGVPYKGYQVPMHRQR
jgi:hypothetical protein